MNKRPKLSFYTNMPTPYQLDFFDSLADIFDLRVIYSISRENDRFWVFESQQIKYSTITLKSNLITRLIQKRIVSFHFDFRIIRELKSDPSSYAVVNGTYWSPNVILSLIILHYRRKKVFFFSEPLFDANPIIYKVKRGLLYFVKKYTQGVFAIGKNAVLSFQNYGYTKPIYNIPYNIDITKFDKANMESNRLVDFRKKYNADGKVVLMTSGSLLKRKGVDAIINSFKKIDSNNAKLLILGDGPESNYLKELVVGLPNVEFLGFIETKEIPYIFAISDIFVFASKYDGWALVINEAIAAGLSIICSRNVGSAADKLIHGNNALLFDPADVDELASLMTRLISSPVARDKLSLNVKELRNSISSPYNAKIVYGICRNS